MQPIAQACSRDQLGAARRRLLLSLLAVALALGGAIGYAAWKGELSTPKTAVPSGTGAASTSPTLPPATGPGLELPVPPSPSVVLPELASSSALSGKRLRRQLVPLLTDPALRRHLGVEVAALGGSGPSWTLPGAARLVTPASTLKLLTTVTALATLGPERVFETQVVRGRSRGRLVLVGGGDPLLTDEAAPVRGASAAYPSPASLEDLAGQTAAALADSGVQEVTLGYDDSLFSGPAVNTSWPKSYVIDDVVSPITALWVDEGRAEAGYADRVVDPSATAARRFAVLLRAEGVLVQGPVEPRTSPHKPISLGTVSSPPVAAIVEHVLELSDNEGAEVLMRQAAIASGRRGSFAGGVATVQQVVGALGVEIRGARLYDGSGLSRRDALPVNALIDILRLAASEAHPELRAVVAGLPVAGFTGSLAYRFVEDAPTGLGLVRAKTGTLTGVHALAGVTVTADGRPVAFALVADRVPVRLTLDARAQLDRIAAALANCRCGAEAAKSPTPRI